MNWMSRCLVLLGRRLFLEIAALLILTGGLNSSKNSVITVFLTESVVDSIYLLGYERTKQYLVFVDVHTSVLPFLKIHI